MEELKQSYENRIERLKHEAEPTVTNAMAETDKVVASVKSLYENEVDKIINYVHNLGWKHKSNRRNGILKKAKHVPNVEA